MENNLTRRLDPIGWRIIAVDGGRRIMGHPVIDGLLLA